MSHTSGTDSKNGAVIFTAVMMFALLFLPGVHALNTWDTPKPINDADSIYGVNVTQLKAQYFNGEWYVGYTRGYNSTSNFSFRFGVFNYDLSSTEHSYMTPNSASITTGRTDNDETTCGVSSPTPNATYCDFVNATDYGYSGIFLSCHMRSMGCNALQFLSIKNDTSNSTKMGEISRRPMFTAVNNHGVNSSVNIFSTSNGSVHYSYRTGTESLITHSLDLPATVAAPLGNFELHDNAYGYKFFIVESNKKIYLVTYNSAMTRLNSQEISNGSEISANPTMAFLNSVYHIAYETDGGFLRYSVYDFDVSGGAPDFHLMETTTLNFTQGTSNITVMPMLSPTNDRMFIFYGIRSTGSGVMSGIYGRSENITCTCTDYINTTCTGDYRAATRSCNYESCTTETFTYDPYGCNLKYVTNEGGRFRIVENSKASECSSAWSLPGQTAECILSASLPSDCFNMTVTETTQLIFKTDTACSTATLWVLFPQPAGTYWLDSCTPYSQCTRSSTFSCYNQSYGMYASRTYTDYETGQTATGRARASIDSDCGCKESFYVKGTLGYNCLKACSAEWICKDGATKVFLSDDCSYSNETVCDYACLNGACTTAGIFESAKKDYGNSFVGAVDVLKGMAPNSDTKLIIWIIMTLGVTLAIIAAFRDVEHIYIFAIVAALMMFVLGIALGFVPGWVAFLMALPIVFIIAKSFWGGGG